MSDKKKWELFYEEKNFRSFKKLLLVELTDDDRENAPPLRAKYGEDDLPSDPVRKLLVSLTANQRTAFDAVVANHSQSLPTKIEVLRDPDSAFERMQAILADSNIPAGKLDVYNENRKNHLKTELSLYKKLTKTCLHSRYMIDLAPFGAGREFLRVMRERNRINKTEEDSDELMNQLLAFRIRHAEKVEDYKIRLADLKHDLETADADPQPISAKFHRRIYVAGLRSNPVFNKALNAIKDVEQQTLAYIHSKMTTAQGDSRKRIQQMHGSDVGVSVVQNVVATPSPSTTGGHFK